MAGGAVYDAEQDRFLVNIRDPAVVAVVDPEAASLIDTWSISSPGPHGLGLDGRGRRAFIACDGGHVICLASADGSELARVPIAGEPDAIWFDDAASSLYVAIGRPGLVQVIDTGLMAVNETIATEEGATTTAFDSRRRVFYVFRPVSCTVAAFQVVNSPG